jgi:hypothetical protein
MALAVIKNPKGFTTNYKLITILSNSSLIHFIGVSSSLSIAFSTSFSTPFLLFLITVSIEF